jgi:hypothetical protein
MSSEDAAICVVRSPDLRTFQRYSDQVACDECGTVFIQAKFLNIHKKNCTHFTKKKALESGNMEAHGLYQDIHKVDISLTANVEADKEEDSSNNEQNEAENILLQFQQTLAGESELTKELARDMLRKARRAIFPAPKIEPFTLEEVKEILNETRMSQKQFLTLCKRLGRKWGTVVFKGETQRQLIERKKDPAVMADSRLSSTNPLKYRKKTGKEVNCEICGREFSGRFTLKRHMKRCINYPHAGEWLEAMATQDN